MRWIFFFLVAANVGLLLWRVFAYPSFDPVRDRPPVISSQAFPGAKQLVLLSELDPAVVPHKLFTFLIERYVAY